MKVAWCPAAVARVWARIGQENTKQAGETQRMHPPKSALALGDHSALLTEKPVAERNARNANYRK
jgi:hypothetical protein